MTAQRIVDLNRQFYQTFAAQFSATRQRLQPGVVRLQARISRAARLLDLGCGNGELWRALARGGHYGGYLGVDFSPALLAHAPLNAPIPTETPAQPLTGANRSAEFIPIDLTGPDWRLVQERAPFDLAVAFAVLHHIPGRALRLQLLRNLRACLPVGGLFFVSNWQFLNSPRLAARIQTWALAGLDSALVDPDDYLLDWREGGAGLRYVHHFSPAELEGLAAESGFTVLESFLSDGKSGNLGLYQVWKAAE